MVAGERAGFLPVIDAQHTDDFVFEQNRHIEERVDIILGFHFLGVAIAH